MPTTRSEESASRRALSREQMLSAGRLATPCRVTRVSSVDAGTYIIRLFVRYPPELMRLLDTRLGHKAASSFASSGQLPEPSPSMRGSGKRSLG